ncbi:class I SAM-dependent methyltransferase [Streptomyces sp. NPDC059785]|uniref:class I SAM-dependent methyltransferase n=1 Tax=Streptomyces sp. NPDC059785 TaxID=3346945 RepID=UPI00364D5128
MPPTQQPRSTPDTPPHTPPHIPPRPTHRPTPPDHPTQNGASAGDRLHEPRREDCPWCGSARLRTRLRTPGPGRRRAGTFVVDECRECGHAFQNPRLTAEGLAFHHADFHEGHDAFADRILTARGSRSRHLAAARAVLALPAPEPESWLDVGTRNGHFPQAAREVHAYTAFDGLDAGARVEQAYAAGRVDEAHVGRLTDPVTAGRLRGRYDVVSMFHHLEHTADPRAELRAALAALRPGGHLLIEVPDPASAFGTLLGRWWVAYGQPAHLHLMPLPNLVAELRALGCEVVSTDRREPHVPYDLTGALALALARVLPDVEASWRAAPPTEAQRAVRAALVGAATPLLAAACAVDHALAPLLRRTRFSNAYRIIARRTP